MCRGIHILEPPKETYEELYLGVSISLLSVWRGIRLLEPLKQTPKPKPACENGEWPTTR